MKLLLFTGALLIALTTACQPLIIPVTPTAASPAENATENSTATATTPITATNTATNTVAETASAAETAAMSTTTTVTATPVVSTTTTVSVTADTPVTPTEPATTTATVAQATPNTAPVLTVVVASLRLRAGPGTEYTILGAATQGDQYPIRGQAYDCQWYQVTHPQLGEVWLSGGSQYVATDVTCDQITQVAAPALPTPPPAPTAAPTATPAPAQAQQADSPAPAPTEPPTQPADDPFPADQGCLLLQNQLGPELTFTFTSADGGWSDIVKVSAEQDVPYCFKPGHYRVTVDAPPPWASLNRDFEIKAGDRAYFPIRPQ